MLCLITSSNFASAAQETESAVATETLLSQAPSYSRDIDHISKQILLKTIDLNRFILHYRLESNRQPPTRLIRYFLGQEANFSCLMAYNIVATDQFGKHLNTPLAVNVNSLRNGFNTVLVGTAIGGASSAFELGSNILRGFVNKSKNFDSLSAERYFVATMGNIDTLLAQRESMVYAHPNNPSYEKYVLEGTILKQIRQYYLLAFMDFHADTVYYRYFESTYFLLNTAANACGLSSAIYGIKALKQPKFTGTGNILFTVAGALVTAGPSISTVVARQIANYARCKFKTVMHETPHPDYDALQKNVEKLQQLTDASAKTHDQLTARLGLYDIAGPRFKQTIAFETKRLNLLQKVAIETSIGAPVIGGATLTQGILGTTAYYKYQRPPITLDGLKNADALNFAGAITGTAGAGAAVLATAGLFGGTLYYRHKLRAEHKSPQQMIQDRLDYLNQLENEVKALP